jgi:FkbM family methyltransferase
VDIGANDGLTFSNTYFFEKKGWQGLCVEPLPEVFKKLRVNRHCACICGAISPKNQEYTKFLHVTGKSEMLSGVLAEYRKEHLQRIDREINTNEGTKEILEVKNYSFNEAVTNHNIDYLSLDTEGSEFSILENIDFAKFTIKVISIENDYDNQKIYNFLKNLGFIYLKTIGSDELYINKNYTYLINSVMILSCNLFLSRLYRKVKKLIKNHA